MKLCSSQCKIKFLSLRQGSVVSGPWGQHNWNTSKNVLFLFWNGKVFLENFNQEVNFISLVRYLLSAFIFYFLFHLISTSYACFTTICICFYLTLCLYFSEQTGHNTEACCILVVLALHLKIISKVPFVFGWDPWDCTLLLTMWINLWCWCISNTLRTQVL